MGEREVEIDGEREREKQTKKKEIERERGIWTGSIRGRMLSLATNCSFLASQASDLFTSTTLGGVRE